MNIKGLVRRICFFYDARVIVFYQINTFNAISEKKYFDTDQPISTGWTKVTVKECQSVQEATILPDRGLGYEEAYNTPLSCINNTLSTSIIELPQGIQSMRLVLTSESPEALPRTITLRFIPIFKFEAFIRTALYLYRLNRLRCISTSQIIHEKWHQIRKAGFVNIFKNLEQFYEYGDTKRPLGYHQWIRKNERLSAEKIEVISRHCYMNSPSFSLVCQYNGDIVQLEKTIFSLQSQTYKHWQLFLLLTTQGNVSELKKLVDHHFTSIKDKVSVVYSDELGEINQISHTLPLLSGEFGLWMSAGDQLSPFALYRFVKAINIQPEISAWYCDSDQINDEGERHTPCFLPKWNKELFYCQNYIGGGCLFHLPTMRKCCAGEVLTQYAEKYDAFLRILELIPAKRIGHISQVLYHQWQPAIKRKDPNNELTQQRVALKKHLDRIGSNIEVEPGLLSFTHRPIYPLPSILPSVALIIPTKDQVKILKKCIDSILKKSEYLNFHIIVINNNSVEQKSFTYFEKLSGLSNIKVLNYNKPFNFAAINNFAVKNTDANIIGLINNDVEVIKPDWLLEMVRYAVQLEIGCVGPKLLYSDGSIQHAGVICGIGNVAGHAHRYLKRNSPGYFGRLQSSQYFSAVTAACLLVRREIYLKVGGMDDKNLPVAYNDVDFCLKVQKAGYKNVYTPYAELFHHESLSRGPEDTNVKKKRYENEVNYMWNCWEYELQNDPSYNINLSRLREDFSL